MSTSKTKRKNSASFADIDAFWDTHDVSVNSPDETIGTDRLNYDTSSSISESDLEDSSVAPSVASKRQSVSSRDTSRNSFMNSTANSSLPLEDSEEEGDLTVSTKRSSVEGSNITGRRSSVTTAPPSPPVVTPKGKLKSTGKEASSTSHFNYDTSVDTPAAFQSEGSVRSTPASAKSKRVSFSAEKAPLEDSDQAYGFDVDDNEPFEEPPSAPPSSEKKVKSVKKSKTPLAKRTNYMEYDPKTPGSAEFTRGRRLEDESYAKSTGKTARTDDDESSDSDSGFVEDTSYLQSAREKSADESEDSDDQGIRRSRRVTKGMKFQYWKNERPVYEEGRIVGVLTAEPTPRKPKRKRSKQDKNQLKKIKLNVSDLNASESSDEELASRHPFKIPTTYQYTGSQEGELLQVWDDVASSSTEVKVLSNRENLNPPSSLPITAERPPGKTVAALAAQSFNVPEVPGKMSGWISGFVELPPQAIKDAEGVGLCSQVFFIGSCQSGSVELGIASPESDTWEDKTAQRRLLSTGDTFYVPPGNIYRVENHSAYKACTIYWTIIKPIAQGEEMGVADGDY